MTAIEEAYASNTETPILTVQFVHPAITGGILSLVQSSSDLVAVDENSSQVTFQRSGINVTRPEKSTDGDQSLNIQIDNTSNLVFREISNIENASLASETEILCVFRTYLPSDLSGPSGQIYYLTAESSSISGTTATISARFAPIPDVSYPRKRYFATNFPGVRYAG